MVRPKSWAIPPSMDSGCERQMALTDCTACPQWVEKRTCDCVGSLLFGFIAYLRRESVRPYLETTYEGA
jgi:hypothetical protein